MYLYKTQTGVKRKISSIENSIRTFKRLRGSNHGTFWKDVAAVDTAIREKENDIRELKIFMQTMTQPKELVKQLKSSEIF